MRTILLIMAFFGNTQLYADDCSALLDVDVKTLNKNKVINLCDEYQGKVLLVVNTASKCAYTNQYDSLEKLYKKYQDKGLVVLGFPSNDFANQEPGTEKEIRDFCSVTYGVEFPMFSKTRVTQANAGPFYKKLAAASGSYPKWNFHKYLIGSDGLLVSSYPSAIDPLNRTIVDVIEAELKKHEFESKN
ncbi:MAG: glutathione peroxidase [Gammaproteobacteria bacterium]|nr:glutathione peroxidase [Gammaproteobacteria bacterium]